MKKEFSTKQRDESLAALKARFDANQARHPGLVWAKVQARLEAKPDKLRSCDTLQRGICTFIRGFGLDFA